MISIIKEGFLTVAAELVIYALIAAGLVIWLRNILGTRTGDERERPNPFAQKPDGKPVLMAGADADPVAGILPGHQEPVLERHMNIVPAAQIGLAAVGQADRDFVAAHFLHGAQEAFVMIVEAFARADRATLKDLLAPSVYEGFDSVLREREEAGQTAQVEIHAVRKVELLAARLDGRMAYITVRFVADETSVLRDAAGDLLSGHPDRVTETVDIWTFGRDVKGRDPVWFVYETREGAGDEQAGSTVPDAVG